MSAENLKDLAVTALDDLKGRDIVCMDIAEISTIADYMVVATGTSNRHVKSLSEEVVKKVKEAGGTIKGVEGERQAEWVLIDLGDVVVHAMLPETRAFYQLEKLWDKDSTRRTSSQ